MCVVSGMLCGVCGVSEVGLGRVCGVSEGGLGRVCGVSEGRCAVCAASLRAAVRCVRCLRGLLCRVCGISEGCVCGRAGESGPGQRSPVAGRLPARLAGLAGFLPAPALRRGAQGSAAHGEDEAAVQQGLRTPGSR